MGLKVNIRGVKGDMDDIKAPGFGHVPDGRGLVCLKDFQEAQQLGKSYGHKIFLEIIAWSDPAGIAMVHEEPIFLPSSSDKEDRSQPKLLRLAVALGFLTPAQADAIRAGQGEFDFDYVKCFGRPLFTEVVTIENAKDKKQYHQVAESGAAYYHIGDPRVKDWPTNAGFLAQYGAACGTWQPLPKKEAPATAGNSVAAGRNLFAPKT